MQVTDHKSGVTKGGAHGRGAEDRIETVTGDSFDKLVVEGGGAIAVEFMSYGCVHCREIESVLQEVAGLLASEVKIYRVNVAVEEDLARSFDIQGTPTLIMFKHGMEVGREEGAAPDVSTLQQVIMEPFEA